MSEDFNQLERRIERDMRLLRYLPQAELSRDGMQRLRARVLAEAGGRRASRWRTSFGAALTAAAALVAAIGWHAYGPNANAPGSERDPFVSLEEWTTAIDASVSLLDEAGMLGLTGPYEETEDFEALFDGLEQSINMLDEGT